METLHQMGFIISINSNGTMIDEETVEWLKKCPPVRINMTLYGSSDETYERLCRNPKGFTQAVRAIHLLKDAGITVKINCSVTPYNVSDLEDIIQFAMDEHLIITPTSYMFPPLRKDQSMIGINDRFTAEEAAYYQAKCEYLLSGKERFIEKVNNDEMEGLYGDLEDDCSDIEGEDLRCRAGKCCFWITWNGRMLPCGMFANDAPYMNVFENDFDDCWNTVTETIRRIRLPAKCAGCKIKDKCKACAV